jgi:hypothetical protein
LASISFSFENMLGEALNLLFGSYGGLNTYGYVGGGIRYRITTLKDFRQQWLYPIPAALRSPELAEQFPRLVLFLSAGMSGQPFIQQLNLRLAM